MGLKTMSLLTGATVSASGGTALAFLDDGISIQNGLHMVVPSDTDYQTRRQATAKVKQPILDPKTGAYGKDRKTISLTFPMVLPDGKVIFNVIRVEREVHPSFSAANALELNKLGAQLLIDSDCADFWAAGTLG
jgi:hypothetical protein